MAKEVAILKRAKISQAQKYVLLAVLGASLFLGAAASLVKHFTDKIAFNIDVISEEERAIAAYSDAIKNLGVCRAPIGSIYTDAELAACNPDDIDISAVPNTLRSNIMEYMAANKALNSVKKEDESNCLNPITNKSYTYNEMQELYNNAETTDARRAASNLIKSCSALRVIPDALPSTRNEEALLASLNKIFIVSGWLPENISPSGDSGNGDISEEEASTLNAIAISLSIEADSTATMEVLHNIERSIRDFNIAEATIEWNQGGLTLSSTAGAFYVNKSTITEAKKEIKPKNGQSAGTSTASAGGTQ